MKKEDVETHNERGLYSRQLPAVNVKAYDFPYTPDVQKKFGCSEETADQAIEYAFEMAQDQFWEDIKEVVKEIWGDHVKAHSAGRSGGWLIVDGLGRVADWDAVMLGKWAKLCRICREEIKYLCSKDYVFEMIEANRWHEDGAERYNFYDTKNGESVCIVDRKEEAKAAGFGDLIK